MVDLRDLSDDELLDLYNSKVSEEELLGPSPAETGNGVAAIGNTEPVKDPSRVRDPAPNPVPDDFEGAPPPPSDQIFEGFDNLTDDELIEMYRKKGGDMSTVRTPGVLDYAHGASGQFNEGLVELAGLPVDLVASAMELAGADFGEEGAFGGSKWIKRVLGNVENLAGVTPGSLTEEGPNTQLGRMIGRATKELGASAIPAAGTLKAGAKAAQSAISGIPKEGFKGALQEVLKRVGASPGTALTGETIAATGAGIGAGTANELAPGSVGAEIMGQLLGGLLPAGLAAASQATLSSMVLRFTRRLSKDAQRKSAEELTKQFLEDDITTEALERLSRSEEISDRIPGFQPTTAERTGTPGLLEAQRVLEKAATPEAVQRRIDSEKAIESFTQTNAPRAEQDLEFVVDTAKRQTDDVRRALDTQAEEVLTKQENLASTLPLGDPAGEGALLRSSLEGRFGDEQKLFSQHAVDAGLEDDTITFDFKPMGKSLLDAYKGASKFMTRVGKKKKKEPLAPNVPVLTRIKRGRKIREQTLPAILELRSDISKQIRDVDKLDAPDPKIKRGLHAMLTRFDEVLEETIANSGDPDLINRYREFNAAYRKDMIEVFKSGPTAKVLRKTPRGVYVTPNEQVFGAYFKPNAVAGARQFNRIFKDDAAAYEGLRNAALDSLRASSVREGVLKEGNMNNWLGRHRTVLNEFPGLKQEVMDVDTRRKALVARAQELQNRKDAVGKRLLTKRLNRYTDASIPAERVIEDAITRPQMMDDLVTALRGEPDAMAALRRAVWDQVNLQKPGEMTAFMADNARSIDKVMGKEHRDALKIIDGARAMLAQTATPTPDITPPNVRDAFVKRFGIGPDVLANRIHAINTGRSEKSWVVTNVFFNIIGRQQKDILEDVLRTVLYDPEVAVDLAQSLKTGRVSDRAANRLGARWFALGLTPLSGSGEDE